MFSLQKWLGFGLIADGAARSAKSMNRDCLGKRKFRFHLDLKKTAAHSPDTKNRKNGKIHNVKSSRERQVKAQWQRIVP